MKDTKIKFRNYHINEGSKEIIEMVRDYLFRVGIATSRERAWAIFQEMQYIPYRYLIEKNKDEGIEYQGSGKYISNKDYPNQALTIQGVGRYELKAIKDNANKKYKANIIFKPARTIKDAVGKIKVKDNEDL